MSFNHLNNEAPGKRFLFVRLEQPERHSTDWRHIVATVVREAVSHIPPNENKTWWDYYDEDEAKGYRCSSWSARSPKAVYTDDLQLRGQIDVGGNEPLNNGRPYANRTEFCPYSVNANNARAMNDFFTKMYKFYDKHNYHIESDSFLGSLYALSEFLGIKTFLFYAPGITSSSLNQKDNFIECNFAEATEQINKILAPFSRG